jgi:hypothetical protein
MEMNLNPPSLYPTSRKISASKSTQKTLTAWIVGMNGWMILIEENQEGEDSTWAHRGAC